MVALRHKGYRHLPPGRQPGRQSRRDRYGFPLFIFMGVVVGVPVFAALSVFSLSDGAFGRGDLLFPAFTLANSVGGYVYFRERFPRRSRHLRIAVSPLEVRRGEAVTATVTIDGEPRLDAAAVQVGLVCVERYDQVWRGVNLGKRSITGGLPVTEIDIAHEDWRDVKVSPTGTSERFEIPLTAPYSYEGHHVSFAWRLSARLPDPGRADPTADHPIWVLP